VTAAKQQASVLAVANMVSSDGVKLGVCQFRGAIGVCLIANGQPEVGSIFISLTLSRFWRKA